MVSSQSTFLGRWGHLLVRGGWNLSLMAQGPVSIAAEDLLPGLHPAWWTFDSQPEEREPDTVSGARGA